MRSGGRRPGTGTSFLDSTTSERLLEITASEAGETFFAFTLYDCHGRLVADSDGPHTFLEGKEVRDQDKELLLLIPSQHDGHIEYRLYSDKGTLLTCSDGARTQLFGGIKLEAIKPPVRPPFSPSAARPSRAPETPEVAAQATAEKRQPEMPPLETRSPA